MAKLNGVRTIDMVNGEITKIAYDGAEYVKVEGEAKVDDILLRVKNGIPTQVTVGEFYEAHRNEGGNSDRVYYRDEGGDVMTSRSSNFVAFRKVNADTTTVLAEVADRVTALEGRVDALEGKDDELKKGDKVRISGASVYGKDSDGEYGTYQYADSDGEHFVKLESGPGRYFLRSQLTKVNESNEPAKPQYKTVKRHAKVGERILITEAAPIYDQSYGEGAVFTVTEAGVIDRGDVHVAGQSRFVDYQEYEVIVEDTADKPAKPTQSIDFKGAAYTLVDRKAQPGDVVVFTETGGQLLKPHTQYEVLPGMFVRGDDRKTEVYKTWLGRTEANTLVYAPKEQTLQVGDYVKPLPSAAEYSITDGRMNLGKVKTVDNDFFSIEIVAHEISRYIGRVFRVKTKHFRKATAEEVEAVTQPKTGDIVVITGNTNASKNKVGDIGKVSGEVSTVSSAVVYVPGGPTHGIYTRYDEMRLATPAEIAKYEAAVKEAEKPKLKAGDYVRALKSGQFNDIHEGDYGKVEKVIGYDGYGVKVRLNDDSDYDYFRPQDLELVDAETAQKAELFAKIGRKVDEFKKGDIVRGYSNRDSEDHYGVIEDLAAGGAYTGVRVGDKYRALLNIELIAPVESRVDVE